MTETEKGDRPNTASDPSDSESRPITQQELLAVVASKEARKLQARREKEKSVWFGLGMFGMIGWSVAVPTLLALALGLWLDRHWPVYFSWTLTLLFIGLALGCLNAWFWVLREREPIERKARPSPMAEDESHVATEEEENNG
jgi:ATP synthase protein I